MLIACFALIIAGVHAGSDVYLNPLEVNLSNDDSMIVISNFAPKLSIYFHKLVTFTYSLILYFGMNQ